jgi:hypothetical protein
MATTTGLPFNKGPYGKMNKVFFRRKFKHNLPVYKTGNQVSETGPCEPLVFNALIFNDIHKGSCQKTCFQLTIRPLAFKVSF